MLLLTLPQRWGGPHPSGTTAVKTRARSCRGLGGDGAPLRSVGDVGTVATGMPSRWKTSELLGSRCANAATNR